MVVETMTFFIASGGSVARLVVEDGCKPPFCLGQWPALATGVVLSLVTLDSADAEIVALRMREIKSRHRRSGPHGKALGELDAGGGFCVEEMKQRPFFRVVRLGRVSRSGSDTPVRLSD